MKTKPSSVTPPQLLAQIAQIQSMELGKLSEYRPTGRSADSTAYFKLQSWEQGKNLTRHIRPEEVPAVREAIEGYARFRALVEQYTQLIVAETRDRLEQGVKKKIRPYSRHYKKKSIDSSNRS
jgi:hypothetical protein